MRWPPPFAERSLPTLRDTTGETSAVILPSAQTTERMLGTVSIIGGAGHVGLGFALVLADASFRVYGIDVNAHANALIMSGTMPFVERQGEAYLRRALDRGLLQMTASTDSLRESDVVAIILGTPIDENMNPNLLPLLRVVEQNICPNLRPQQLLILRSTVSPGTTGRVKELIESRTGLVCGKDFYLVYAPERVLQTRAIEEIKSLPQLIGSFDAASERRAREFFDVFIPRSIGLAPAEAEIAKLITNMARYVEFALANEFYLIAESYGANAHRILDAANQDYPRLRIPNPGPNVGGPCLYKDGFFLIERIPFAELISTAFKINEGMPIHIIQQLSARPEVRKVGVLGLTFKANCDDTRNSLSYKLLKQLCARGYDTCTVDPYVEGCANYDVLRASDAVVLMTPHDAFRDFKRIYDSIANPDCWVVDIWGFWPEMRGLSRNGFFRASELTTLRAVGVGA
jgi:UDP-N-acetyl-D-mannosaminuronic acid dehydrogenase